MKDGFFGYNSTPCCEKLQEDLAFGRIIGPILFIVMIFAIPLALEWLENRKH